MRCRAGFFLQVLLLLAIALSGTLASISATNEVVGAPAASSDELSTVMAARNPRKERKQDREDDRNGADEQQVGHDRVGDWRAFCSGPEMIRLRKVELCTHGPDPAPPGFDIEDPLAPLSAEVTDDVATLACEGDGQEGFRVEVLYVRGSSGAPLVPALESSIRGWAAGADQIFQASAAQTGGVRGLRFVQEMSPLCEPTVTELQVSPGGLTSFGSMVNQLDAQGFDREDRIYLAFVDAIQYCGIGTVVGDDRLTADNWNNVGPSYARVDRGCWFGENAAGVERGAFVAAHELMHNLGGVQPGAPNATSAFHCVDEWDVMCYSDQGSGIPPMHYLCQPQSQFAARFDCNADAYYHTNPSPGSYLATCWNPANNRFLAGAALQTSEVACVPQPPPSIEPTVPTSDDTNDKKDKKDQRKKHKKEKKHHKRRHDRRVRRNH